MHIYIFSFLNICYNNDRKFKYFFRNNHPTIHTNLYILGYFFSVSFTKRCSDFYTAFGSQCKRGTLRFNPSTKKIPRDVEKVGLPIQKRYFLLSSNIQIFNDKKSES
jgi:hypothetical protein